MSFSKKDGGTRLLSNDKFLPTWTNLGTATGDFFFLGLLNKKNEGSMPTRWY